MVRPAPTPTSVQQPFPAILAPASKIRMTGSTSSFVPLSLSPGEGAGVVCGQHIRCPCGSNGFNSHQQTGWGPVVTGPVSGRTPFPLQPLPGRKTRQSLSSPSAASTQEVPVCARRLLNTGHGSVASWVQRSWEWRPAMKREPRYKTVHSHPCILKGEDSSLRGVGPSSVGGEGTQAGDTASKGAGAGVGRACGNPVSPTAWLSRRSWATGGPSSPGRDRPGSKAW